MLSNALSMMYIQNQQFRTSCYKSVRYLQASQEYKTEHRFSLKVSLSYLTKYLRELLSQRSASRYREGRGWPRGRVNKRGRVYIFSLNKFSGIRTSELFLFRFTFYRKPFRFIFLSIVCEEYIYIGGFFSKGCRFDISIIRPCSGLDPTTKAQVR